MSGARQRSFLSSYGPCALVAGGSEGIGAAFAVRPGATRTPGWLRSRPAPGAVPLPVLEPQEVVDAALAALGRGPSVIPGRWNRLAGLALARLLPRRAAITILSDAARRLYPDAP